MKRTKRMKLTMPVLVLSLFPPFVAHAAGPAAKDAAAGAAPSPGTPAYQAENYRRIGLDQRPGARVDLSLPFRDESGADITLGQVADGRPLLVVPVYYRCPMLCTYVLNGLAQGLDDISLQPGKDYRVAAVSIDPREGPKLAADKKQIYLGRIGRDRGAEEGWRFLTGKQPRIAALTASLGFRYAYDSVRNEYAHPAAVAVLTPAGVISRYFPGVDFPPRELRLGLVAASDGKLGGITDKVFLSCYRYNPVTGKYTPYVGGALRIMGVGVILGLIAGGAALERKGRRRARAAAGKRRAETAVHG